jgi:hypothetical protein
MSGVILPDPRNTDYVHPLSIEAYQALGEMGHLGKKSLCFLMSRMSRMSRMKSVSFGVDLTQTSPPHHAER